MIPNFFKIDSDKGVHTFNEFVYNIRAQTLQFQLTTPLLEVDQLVSIRIRVIQRLMNINNTILA